MEKIKALVSSSRVEDKIAGIFLANRSLEAGRTGSSGAVLELVSAHIPVPHVLTFVQMKAYPQVQQASLRLLEHMVMDNVHGSVMLLSQKSAVIQTLFSLSNSTHVESLANLILQLAMLHGQEKCLQLIKGMLQEGRQQGSVHMPHLVLQCVSDLVHLLPPPQDSIPVTSTSSSDNNSKAVPTLSLDQSEASFLQVCMIQGLHGAAQEHIRDITLRAIVQLLQSPHIPITSWLSLSFQSPASKDETKEKKKTSFVAFLCAIVYGELHLMEEEILYFARSVCNSSTDNVAEGNQQEPQQRRQRLVRDVQMFRQCFDIVDWIVSSVLLPEDEQDDSIASTMSYQEVQQLQKDLYRIVEELWEYFKVASSLISSSTISDNDTDILTTIMRLTSSRALSSLQPLVLEDSELRTQFLQQLPNIVQLSAFYNTQPCNFPDSFIVGLSITVENDVTIMKENSSKQSTIASFWNEKITLLQEKDVLVTLTKLMSTLMSAYVCQDIVHANPIDLMDLDEANEEIVEKISEQSALVVRFACEALTYTKAHPSSPYHEHIIEAYSSALHILHIIIMIRETSLKSLLRGEGALAFEELLHCPASLFQQLHPLLHHITLHPSIHQSNQALPHIKYLQQRLQSFTELELSMEDLED